MADELKVTDSPGGIIPSGIPSEVTSGVSPEEQKFQVYVSRERASGNTAPQESLRRTFDVRMARAARSAGNVQSSRAHYESIDNETVEDGPNIEHDTAASLTGRTSDVNVVSGLTQEQEREVAGGRLGSSPTLPPVDSPQITADEAYAFVGTTLARHRERNGEPLELDTILEETAGKPASSSPQATGGARSGSGAAGLSMRIGAGGSNLTPSSKSVTTSNSQSQGSSKYSSALVGSRYNWPNLERELVEFMLREAKDNPELRRLLKALRTASAKSSLGGRELEKTVTEIRQFNQKMRMAQGAMQASERASQGIAQARADGVTGKVEDDDPTQSVTEKDAHPRRLRERMAEVVDKVDKQEVSKEPVTDPDDTAHLKETPRTMLTADELKELKENQPELYKEYADAFQEYQNFHPSTALASLKQNRALLTEDKRAGFDEVIAETEALVTERSRGAFSDVRGFGMLEFNRSKLYQQVKEINRQFVDLKALRTQVEEAKTEGNEPLTNKLQARLDARESGMDIRGMHKRKIVLLESIVETDRRLAAHRPLTPEMIESKDRNHEAQKKGIEERVPALKEEITKAEADYKENPNPKTYAVLEAKRFELHEVESTSDRVMDYMDRLYDSMKNRRMIDDTGALDPTADDTDKIVITENDELPTDLDKRMEDLETRARAGEQFLSDKSGLFDIRGERSRDISIGHVERTLDKLANPWEGSLARAAGGTIGDAKANAKQAGGAIRAVENVQDMTSRLMSLADQARKMRG